VLECTNCPGIVATRAMRAREFLAREWYPPPLAQEAEPLTRHETGQCYAGASPQELGFSIRRHPRGQPEVQPLITTLSQEAPSHVP